MNRATDVLTTLGHAGRLSVYRLLVRRLPDPVRPGELAEALGLKFSTLSVYLAALEDAGLIRSRRAGKAIHYTADMAQMTVLVDYLVADCCRGRPGLPAPRSLQSLSGARAMTADPTANPSDNPSGTRLDRPFNALFICTGNSARSIFAEALLASEGKGRFVAHSAGTRPQSELNPFAIEVLRRAGHDVSGLRAKTIAEFQAAGAPVMDFVFTVCDRAANEECQPWPGLPVTAHWGQLDPVKATGTEAEKALAFAQTYGQMRRRIQAFVSLPFAQLDRIALQAHLDDIGRSAH